MLGKWDLLTLKTPCWHPAFKSYSEHCVVPQECKTKRFIIRRLSVYTVVSRDIFTQPLYFDPPYRLAKMHCDS